MELVPSWLSVALCTVSRMLLPSICPICCTPGEAPCGPCRQLLKPPGGLRIPPGCDSAFALFAYQGPATELIAALKFRNHRDALGSLSATLALAIETSAAPELVTFVPTASRRRRQRGFDQAELIARCVARELRIPWARLLSRTSDSRQMGLDSTQRAQIRFAPAATCAGVVLVVDDVMTTGASLGAAGRALRSAGASGVIAAALAATPRR